MTKNQIPIKLHNTLTGKKEDFVPLKEGNVGLYVCGITPYDQAHLGHARCYVVFDLLKRVFRKSGYHVTHIQNFTDIDDKIIERAKQKGVSPTVHAKQFIDDYYKWMGLLNVERADQYPLVTTHMKEIQDLIARLIKAGTAYPQGGDVFYAVRKFPSYGSLSKRKIDELTAGARVEIDEKKKDPLDFALWKAAKEGEPTWDSPWGKGRPGWHIECSAMSMKYLGETFDIHGGGQDLIFPHHENEIAQSNAATGKVDGFARTWVHNGFVTINKEKMSKSLGNFFTLQDILTRYDPMGVRYFLLTQHYRSPLNFSDQDLAVAQNTWRDRIVGAHEKLLSQDNQKSNAKTDGTDEIKKLSQEFYDSLRNDLNTPAALGALNQIASWIFQAVESKKPHDWAAIRNEYEDLLETLGLKLPQKETWSPDILDLVQAREAARKSKDWKKSDELRQQLQKKQVLVEDTPNGPALKRI